MKPTPELFKIIQENFEEPDAFTEDDVEVFNYLLCDTSYNKSWNMRLSSEFVKGYAQKANEGDVAITALHSHDKLAFGRTIKGFGFFENDSAFAKIYLMKDMKLGGDINSNDVIRNIKAGTTMDGSIEFYPHEVLCSVCGNDLNDWGACSHIPGQQYDGKLCYGIVGARDAVYSNYSIVPDGSIEGAKRLGAKYFEVPNKGKFRVFNSVSFDVRGNYELNIKKQEAIERMDEKKYDELLDALSNLSKSNEGLKLSVDKNKELEDEIAKLKKEHQEDLDAVALEVTQVKEENEKLSEFKEAFLSLLKEDGVRAYGKAFDEKIFESKSIDELSELRKGFIEMASSKVNYGKVSPDGEAAPIKYNEDYYKI